MQTGRPQSSKRHRPHVPLDQRKRAVQACVQCRISKKKCRPGLRDQCASCARSRQACIFDNNLPSREREARSYELPEGKDPSISQSSSMPWAIITRDVLTRFNDTCPENSLEPDHFSTLSGLFREAIVHSMRHPDFKDDMTEAESPPSKVNVNAVGAQIHLHKELLVNSV